MLKLDPSNQGAPMFLKTLLKFSQSVLFSAAALFCAVSMAQSVDPKPSHEFTNGKVIANRYIVTFRANVANPALEADNLMQGRGGQIHFRFNNAIKGFAATILADDINSIRNNPNVQLI